MARHRFFWMRSIAGRWRFDAREGHDTHKMLSRLRSRGAPAPCYGVCWVRVPDQAIPRVWSGHMNITGPAPVTFLPSVPASAGQNLQKLAVKSAAGSAESFVRAWLALRLVRFRPSVPSRFAGP